MAEGEVVWEGVFEQSGVTLRKSLEDPIRNPPMAKYELRSTHESPVPVRIVEQIPPALDPEHIGFVSSAGRTGGWRVDEAEIVYEADIAPGGPTRSAIAARGEDMDVIRDLTGEPHLFEVRDPVADGAEEAVSQGGMADGWSDGGVGATLAAELRSGEITDEALTQLRQAFGQDPGRVSDDARIEQLQTDVADLRAERRTLRSGIDRIEQRLDGIEDDHENLRALREDVADVEQELYRFEKTLNAQTADIRGLERSVERVEERLDDELQTVNEFVTAMRQAVGKIDSSDEPDG